MNVKEYIYLEKEDYDKQLKISGDRVKVYSKKKLKNLYPDDDYDLVGEASRKKKKNKDIGRIELADERLYVEKPDSHNKIFRKQDGFVAVDGGGFIALMKLRLLPILLIAVLLLGCVGGGLYGILGRSATTDESEQASDAVDEALDPNIQPAEIDIITISGTVSMGDTVVEGATLSLQSGNEEIATATTDADGNYLIADVANGNYNLVCTYGDSVLTRIATVDNQSIIVDFSFPEGDSVVKALVKITDANTPSIAVNGLDAEAILQMVDGKEVDITFFATQYSSSGVPADDLAAIEAICGDLEMSYFDFSVLKEIYADNQLESSEYLANTHTVLEIAVPFDSTYAVGTYVFRYHGGEAMRLTELDTRPYDDYQDGTYYVTADTVYIYTNCFSTYAIGAANGSQVTRGSDTITYDSTATVDLNTGKITMMYQHDANSTNAAKVEIYLVGQNGNLLISESGTIPAGYSVTEMTLISGLSDMPSVGTYEGLMKIIYLDTEGNTSTNVDIPLSVAITR